MTRPGTYCWGLGPRCRLGRVATTLLVGEALDSRDLTGEAQECTWAPTGLWIDAGCHRHVSWWPRCLPPVSSVSADHLSCLPVTGQHAGVPLPPWWRRNVGLSLPMASEEWYWTGVGTVLARQAPRSLSGTSCQDPKDTGVCGARARRVLALLLCTDTPVLPWAPQPCVLRGHSEVPRGSQWGCPIPHRSGEPTLSQVQMGIGGSCTSSRLGQPRWGTENRCVYVTRHPEQPWDQAQGQGTQAPTEKKERRGLWARLTKGPRH